MVHMYGTRPVCLAHLVSLMQPNKRDKPNKPNYGLLTLADFFNIQLGLDKGDEFLVNQIRSFPLRDVSRFE
jgi:hypothetical protein